MTALVSSRDVEEAYAVEDVSASGALLTEGPRLAIGEVVQVVLRRGERAVARVQARVVRHHRNAPRPTALGVCFEPDTAENEHTLQDVAAEELERASRPGVMLALQRGADWTGWVQSLDALGRATFLAHTPLEAIALVHDHRLTIDTAIVGVDLGTASGLDVLRAIADAAPGVRRVLSWVDDERDQLRDATGTGLVHAAISMPLRREALLEALSLLPDAS